MSLELLFLFFFFFKKTVERSRVYGSGFVCRVSALRIKWAFSEDLKEDEEEEKKAHWNTNSWCVSFFLLVLFCLLFLLSGLIMLRRPSKD